MPYSGIVRGTEGAERVMLEIANAGTSEITCSASLAHWYSAELGAAMPGAAVWVVLWHDPHTGAINLLNATRDRMPVEAIWCRGAGDGRTRIALPFEAGAAPSRLRRTCRDDPDGGLDCRAEAE